MTTATEQPRAQVQPQAQSQAPATIDIIISRHEDKTSSIKNGAPGDYIDNHMIHLSEKGLKGALETGKKELTGEKPIAYAYVVTTDAIRTDQTAHNFLVGAGFEPGKNSDKITRVKAPELGLSGYDWKAPGLPEFGNDQPVLCAYANTLMKDFYLKHKDSPQEEGKKHLVMGERALSLMSRVAMGVQELSQKLKSGERGVLEIVVHAGTIDALQAAWRDLVKLTQNADGTYNVNVEQFDAHNMGQYMKGRIEYQPGTDPGQIKIPLAIKGQTYTLTFAELVQKIQGLGPIVQNSYQAGPKVEQSNAQPAMVQAAQAAAQPVAAKA